MNAAIPEQVVRILPQCYSENTYPEDGVLHKGTSMNGIFLSVHFHEMSDILDYAYILFDDIYDIIGPSDEWPGKEIGTLG